MLKNNKGLYITLLIVLLVILIGIGYFIQTGNSRVKVGPPTYATSTTDTASETASTSDNLATPSEADQNRKIQACATKLEADTKSNKQDYVLGMVIVSFNSDVTLPQAESVLGTYAAKSADQTQEAEYSSEHILTASVPKGFEFVTVCELQADPAVHFSSLDTIFSLHD